MITQAQMKLLNASVCIFLIYKNKIIIKNNLIYLNLNWKLYNSTDAMQNIHLCYNI